MLSLKKISKSYGKNPILKNLDLEIGNQEFLVLLGPSGSGKSTLVRIIAGLEALDSGKIFFDEQDITELEAKDRELSMVFQNYALYPHKTVYQNIAFPLLIQGQNAEEIDKKVKEVSSKLNISELLERKPGQLSGGQRQRVALARAMAKDPKIFLLDEPLSNLDAKLRAKMRKEIFNLRKASKATFIYVTHDQIEALTLGDRIVVLDQGVIQQIGTPQEVYNNPANSFVASFIGSPASNLIDFNDGKITGIRPEYFSLEPSADADFSLDLQLDSIELLGSDYLLYLHLPDGQEIIAKLVSEPKSDELYAQSLKSTKLINLQLFVPKNLLYYFSSADGKRLDN